LDEIEDCYKMHAVITTYEMIVLDSPHLRDVDWKCLIIDEAHRLKNNSCKLVESLRGMQLVSEWAIKNLSNQILFYGIFDSVAT